MDVLILSEEDEQLMADYVKTACDELYEKLQTLLTDKPYEYKSKERVVFNFDLPENFKKESLPVMFTLCKNYMVEGILRDYYENIGYENGIIVSQSNQAKQMSKLQSYRIARTKMIKRKYVGL